MFRDRRTTRCLVLALLAAVMIPLAARTVAGWFSGKEARPMTAQPAWQSATEPKAETIAATAAASKLPAMRVYLDPKGKPIPPPKGAPAFKVAPTPLRPRTLKIERGARGGLHIRGPFLSESIATIGPDGKMQVECRKVPIELERSPGGATSPQAQPKE